MERVNPGGLPSSTAATEDRLPALLVSEVAANRGFERGASLEESRV